MTETNKYVERQRVLLTTPLQRKPVTVSRLVRNPEPDDLEDLAILMLDAYAGTIDASGEETLEDARTEIRNVFEGVYGEPLLDASYVALEDDTPVAVTLVTLYEGAPFLAFVFTGASWKGQGLAPALIQLSMNALAAREYDRLALVVTRGNEAAMRIYKRMGFEER